MFPPAAYEDAVHVSTLTGRSLKTWPTCNQHYLGHGQSPGTLHCRGRSGPPAATVTRTLLLENDPEIQMCPLLLLLLEAPQKQKKITFTSNILYSDQDFPLTDDNWESVVKGIWVCGLLASSLLFRKKSMEGWEWIWEPVRTWWFISISLEHLFLPLHPC